MFLYSSVDIKVGVDSAVGEDGASLAEDLVQQVMAKLANAYLDNLTPKSQADFERFQLYLQETRRLIVGEVQRGSLIITVRCINLEILENLWQAYKSGELNEAAERYLITDELLKEYELRELKLITVIEEEEYRRCKEELTDLEGNLMVASFSLGGWVPKHGVVVVVHPNIAWPRPVESWSENNSALTACMVKISNMVGLGIYL